MQIHPILSRKGNDCTVYFVMLSIGKIHSSIGPFAIINEVALVKYHAYGKQILRNNLASQFYICDSIPF